ncbi:MAG: tetratricopeptide repeat protein [Gemmatimonadetes bacterium]|nr:tetratricopeptide repeat protein [Gemmatimonadota bacterium]
MSKHGDTSRASLSPSQSASANFTRDLIHRRVPHILAGYAAVSWGIVEFTAFAVDEFLLSPYFTRAALVTLVMMVPSVLMVAWFHGKPGKDRDSLPRTEKIGIPANLVGCLVVLSSLATRDDPVSATDPASERPDEASIVQQGVPNSRSNGTTVLFALEPGPGIGEGESWMSYAFPEALVLDLIAYDRFLPIPSYDYQSYARERGFDSFAGTPLPLKRELARNLHAGFIVVGEINRINELLGVQLWIHRVSDGSLAGQTAHEATDLLTLVDEAAGPVGRALGLSTTEEIDDLAVRARLSENEAAVEAFFKGMFHHVADRDHEAASRYLTTATTLDPSFAVAHYALWRVLRASGLDDKAASAPLASAIEHLYRVPERYAFQVRADYYRAIGEPDQLATVLDLWIQLHPDDLNALRILTETQVSQGAWEDALSTLSKMRRLDPLDDRLILVTARVQEQLGNYDQAVGVLAEYVKRSPGDASAYSQLADLQRRLGRLEDARDALKRAIVLDALAPEPVRELAQLDLDDGRLGEARDGFQRVLTLARTAEERVEALSGLKRYHHRRGEMIDAIGVIEQRRQEQAGFQTQPGVALGSLDDIFVYLDAGLVDEAVNLLMELRSTLEGQDLYLHRLAVHIALATEGVDAALEAHRQAWESLEASGQEGLRSTLLGDLGLILDRAGDHEGAAENFKAAIELSPSREFHLGAGRALRRAGLLGEAEAELRSALRLVPADPHVHFEMASLMEARGDTTAAVFHLNNTLAVWENADEDFEPARLAREKLTKLVTP